MYIYIYTEHFLPADMNSTISTVPLIGQIKSRYNHLLP